jgi:hypothetical protein
MIQADAATLHQQRATPLLATWVRCTALALIQPCCQLGLCDCELGGRRRLASLSPPPSIQTPLLDRHTQPMRPRAGCCRPPLSQRLRPRASYLCIKTPMVALLPQPTRQARPIDESGLKDTYFDSAESARPNRPIGQKILVRIDGYVDFLVSGAGIFLALAPPARPCRDSIFSGESHVTEI